MGFQQELQAININDEAAMSALLQKYADEDDKPADDDEQGEAVRPDAQAEGSKAGTVAGAEAKDEPRIDGVLTRDGKHVIPYRALETEREQRREAEKRAKELEQALERMKTEASTRESGGKPTEQAQEDAELFSPEELDALKEDFPAMEKLVSAFRRQSQQIKELSTKPEKAIEHDDEAADVALAQVSEAIQANPLLSKWQQKGGVLWARAAEVDEALKADPKWAEKPLSERFAEVEKLVAEEIGIERQPPKQEQAGGKRKETVRGVESLSDLSGRAPVAAEDEASAMSVNQLSAKFSSMTPEQIETYLSRISA